MTPLPTPFGAVIAASSLAVLGTEFEQAREVNEKLMEKTKPYIDKAREKILSAQQSFFDTEKEVDADLFATDNLSEKESKLLHPK